MANLPYVYGTGTLTTMLAKIKSAAVPPSFSQDFVGATLLMKGGTARTTMPFVKKMGLVADDGTPTELYKQFRNEKKSRAAIAQCMRILYAPLFAMNEKVYDLADNEVRGLIVEATGGEKDSQVTKLTLATFKVLKEMADFSPSQSAVPETATGGVRKEQDETTNALVRRQSREFEPTIGEGINLSYTINLNLPPTSDIEVFNAIFKSLKEHLLQK
ncbi:MAG: DUF5343 domain-containing protein [Candidatus Solibacter sp.]|jgi:hypothetical protein